MMTSWDIEETFKKNYMMPMCRCPYGSDGHHCEACSYAHKLVGSSFSTLCVFSNVLGYHREVRTQMFNLEARYGHQF